MTLSTPAIQLVDQIAMLMARRDTAPTEEELTATAIAMRTAMATIAPVTDQEFAGVVKELQARLSIRMDTGTALTESDHVPWLAAARPQIDPFYWDRFSKYLLTREWSPEVVRTLDRVTDEILDLFGNPQIAGNWKRYGLVLGDVQSGKTATYTSLSCKAADAGYRVIILLTGTLESLRRQTQQRLDEGFVGLDSSELLSKKSGQRDRLIGVGHFDQRRFAGVFTSRTSDFSRQVAVSKGFTLNALKEPVLLVVKKNKRILENLEGWLRSYNADSSGTIDTPMLLIDDEADNASINTADPMADPTVINERIRALMALFRRATFCGFTATPFANVFIDPDTVDDMVAQDLFPKDFIYALEAPTNYIGASRIFGEEGMPGMVRPIEDAEEAFPARHKSGLIVGALPDSLDRATCQFFLANAIRDLREEGATHRSMLVNVSRFTAVQNRVTELIEQRVRTMQQEIRNFSRLGEQEALTSPVMAALKRVLEEDYAAAGVGWPDVQGTLLDSTLPIVVRAVNQQTGAASLDYKLHAENGLRIVAVGGNSLSRGLTLEGLCISYFYRDSRMYDTLMQMGRWFGYRDGYVDLCRLWITREAQHWYAHVTLATEELREEIRRMRRLGMTPKDFGLKVRSHPDALIVTARNKMRLAKTIQVNLSFSGRGIETSKLAKKSVSRNAMAVGRFLQTLKTNGLDPVQSEWGGRLWRDVPKELVIGFLQEFESHPHDFNFHEPEAGDGHTGLVGFVASTPEQRLQTWDMVIPNGSTQGITLIGTDMAIKPLRRTIEQRDGGETLIVSGAKARVGGPGDERHGLTRGQVEECDESYLKENPNKKRVPDSRYRAIRKQPLLLLHLIRPFDSADNDLLATVSPDGQPVSAIGISFPVFDDSNSATQVHYRINLVEWRNLFEVETDDDVAVEESLD